MKLVKRIVLAPVLVLPMLIAPFGRAQTQSQQAATKPAAKTAAKPAASPESDARTKNTDAYIALMRRDIRQEKAEIMGATMALSAQDAGKFWPIYSDYDVELAKLNDQRVANIKEYVANYNTLTDEQADKLIRESVSYQRQRMDLLGKTYEKVKEALGGVTAARFAMVEHQILMLIDLQLVSSLPVAGQSM
jgi:hypothetical protein